MSIAELAASHETNVDTWHVVVSQCGESQIECAAYFKWKCAIGRVLACLMLIPAIPLIIVLALLARASTGASGIYRQRRVGKDGKVFEILKIRTMRADAERYGPQWSSSHDPRITRLGRLFRKAHLDELPQLINVIKGEMALIGPRPERPEFVPVLTKLVPNYLDRLTVPPGITGLAQINLPPDTGVDCVRRKLVLDSQYIRTAGLSQDIRIVGCTMFRLIGMSGETAMKLCGVKWIVELDEVHEHDLCLSPIQLRKQLARTDECHASPVRNHSRNSAEHRIAQKKPR